MKFARIASCLLAAALAVATAAVVSPETSSAATTAGGVYTPTQPCRLLDSRPGVVAAGGSIDLPVAGKCGVPSSATAAFVTLTVAAPKGAGFLTVFPSGTSRPTTSNLNYSSGDTRANATVVALLNGSITVFIGDGSTSVIVDVSGFWTRSPAVAAGGGRLVVVPPIRSVDTRYSTPVSQGQVVNVPLPAAIPSSATAVVANLTVSNTSTAGYLTAYAAGRSQPLASNLNWDRLNQTRSAGAIIPVSAGGFDVYSSGHTDLIVDVTGYLTGPSAQASSEGLLTTITPIRTLDTRGQTATGVSLSAGTTLRANLPASLYPAGTQLINLTVTDTVDAGGYAATAPDGYAPGPVSSINWAAGETTANFAVVPANSVGSISVITSGTGGLHVLVDVLATFSGSPASNQALFSPTTAPAMSGLPYVAHNYWANATPGTSACRQALTDVTSDFGARLAAIGSWGGSISDVGIVAGYTADGSRIAGKAFPNGRPQTIEISCDLIPSGDVGFLVSHEFAHIIVFALGGDYTDEELMDCVASALSAHFGYRGYPLYPSFSGGQIGYGCPTSKIAIGRMLADQFIAAA